ncbi:hypothetical protein V6N13_044104 [Hibiscus sabdariffa]|uniref:Uncharacterized protein n=1 Tax=Hibiscus sabdariffa TaxID=183260 RepID=A0ABR2RHI0_9ROSI
MPCKAPFLKRFISQASFRRGRVCGAQLQNSVADVSFPLRISASVAFAKILREEKGTDEVKFNSAMAEQGFKLNSLACKVVVGQLLKTTEKAELELSKSLYKGKS